MVKIISERVDRFYQNYPTVVAVVTAHAQGRENVMAAAWHSPLSFAPPLYGVSISPKRFTYELILESGEFVVNFLPQEAAELIAAVGGTTGREMDKFDRFQIVREPARKVKAPLLRKAYASFECRVVAHHTYGDHEWFAGEILVVHTQEGTLTEEGILDLSRIIPALYLGADRYLTQIGPGLRHLKRESYARG